MKPRVAAAVVVLAVAALVASHSIGSAQTATAATVWIDPFKPDPFKPDPFTPDPFPEGDRVLFFGDSYTVGEGATDPTKGYAYDVTADLGWMSTIDGSSGTGYLSVGPQKVGTYEQRFTAAPDVGPFDLIVLQGSTNDAHQGENITALAAAVTALVTKMRAAYPGTPIVLLGPVAFADPAPARRIAVDATLQATAIELNVPYISPITGHWFTAADVATLINPDNNHPNDAGHAAIARYFEAAIDRP